MRRSPATLRRPYAGRPTSAGFKREPRAAAHWRAYLYGHVQEATNRQSGTQLTVDEYLRLRRDTIGVQPTLDLAERIGHYELPAALFASDTVTALRTLAAEIDSLHNDLYSLAKENAGSDPHNLLLILRRADGTDHDGARASVLGMLQHASHASATSKAHCAPSTAGRTSAPTTVRPWTATSATPCTRSCAAPTTGPHDPLATTPARSDHGVGPGDRSHGSHDGGGAQPCRSSSGLSRVLSIEVANRPTAAPRDCLLEGRWAWCCMPDRNPVAAALAPRQLIERGVGLDEAAALLPGSTGPPPPG
ncbi:terpene synthase family protein [Streptomyces sp. NBC_01426]|uniref:terpene synthase family protein n=1 Tax=Streptomyces sp. NBC_01426 TaxID=2975866 RepID=UPI003FCDEA6F